MIILSLSLEIQIDMVLLVFFNHIWFKKCFLNPFFKYYYGTPWFVTYALLSRDGSMFIELGAYAPTKIWKSFFVVYKYTYILSLLFYKFDSTLRKKLCEISYYIYIIFLPSLPKFAGFVTSAKCRSNLDFILLLSCFLSDPISYLYLIFK